MSSHCHIAIVTDCCIGVKCDGGQHEFVDENDGVSSCQSNGMSVLNRKRSPQSRRGHGQSLISLHAIIVALVLPGAFSAVAGPLRQKYDFGGPSVILARKCLHHLFL